MRIISFIFRYILAILFIYADIIKFINPSNFLLDIEGYQILPCKMA